MRFGRIWAGLFVVGISAATGSFLGWSPWLAATTAAVLFGLVVAEVLERAGVLKRLGSGVFDTAMAGSRGSSSRPVDLERMERLAGQKVFSANDFDREIRPLIRDLIGARLSARGRTIDEATGSLPPELAALAGTSPTVERGVRRVETRDLQRIVTLIEDLR